MSNLTAYPSFSVGFAYPPPISVQQAPRNMNANMYVAVLHILSQLQAAQSEWNAWKTTAKTFEASLRREQDLRFKDRLNYDEQERQLLGQIMTLRSAMEKVTDDRNTLQHDKEELQQNLAVCKAANLITQNKLQELESVEGYVQVLKASVVNLTKIMHERNDLQAKEEVERMNERFQEALEKIRDRDLRLEDLRKERKALKENLEATKDEIGELKTLEQQTRSQLQMALEEKRSMAETNQARETQLKEEFQKSLADIKNKLEGEKRDIGDELGKCKENSAAVVGSCGPARLKEIKMPNPEGGMYKTGLQRHMLPGSVVHIIGKLQSTGDLPSINFDYPHGIALHIVFRFTSGHICRNTYSEGKWGAEEKGGGMPVKLGQPINVTITSHDQHFQICINGARFASYKHRIDTALITGIWISGPIQLQQVSYFVPTNA